MLLQQFFIWIECFCLENHHLKYQCLLVFINKQHRAYKGQILQVFFSCFLKRNGFSKNVNYLFLIISYIFFGVHSFLKSFLVFHMLSVSEKSFYQLHLDILRMLHYNFKYIRIGDAMCKTVSQSLTASDDEDIIKYIIHHLNALYAFKILSFEVKNIYCGLFLLYNDSFTCFFFNVSSLAYFRILY